MSKDLHVPSAKLVVMYKGKEVMMLNKALLDQQNCWDNLNELKDLHSQRLALEDRLAEGKGDAKLLSRWTLIQFALQKAWGFPEDAKFHRFWDMKGCECPKLDNSDRYPHGFYSMNMGCPIHGTSYKEEEDETTPERS